MRRFYGYCHDRHIELRIRVAFNAKKRIVIKENCQKFYKNIICQDLYRNSIGQDFMES